ncbi:ABC transporter substrate-binding protein, partial [Escherichia coli]
SKGIISTNYGKDPADPQWKDDPGVKAYFAFMDKYYPEGDKLNTVNTYGYSTAELLIQVLKQCGDNLTRENLMKQVTSLNKFVPSLALPG